MSHFVADPTFLTYLVVFAAASAVCFGSLIRARRLDDPDTRRGLVWLLLTSGGWAAAHVGYLALPTLQLQYAFFSLGLIVGLSAVGAWLYFCSAYTGRSIHRNRTVRRVALTVFLVVAASKLTNPLHQQYFVVEVVTSPFPYLLVDHQPAHWIVMGLAYALAFVGFFMLLELFVQINFDARPLFVIAGLTGLPIVLDVLGATTPHLYEFTHSPLGVAVFAIGVLYVYLERFQTIQLAGENDQPIVVLDDGGRVRDYNQSARDVFPDVAGSRGERLDDVAPAIAVESGDSDAVIEIETGADRARRYYQVSSTPFTANRTPIGRAVVLTDVTERERDRQELERQNERLEQFAGIVSHDLRSPLTVAKGRINLALEGEGRENLMAALEVLERMEGLIEDVLALARQGRPIDETERVSLSSIAERSWVTTETAEASLVVEAPPDTTVEADSDRLRQLLENLFRNAVEHGGEDVTVTVGTLDRDDGFYVEDDGTGIPEETREEIFDAGYTTATEGAGFGLAIVREIVEAHGWTIEAGEAADGGARFEIHTAK